MAGEIPPLGRPVRRVGAEPVPVQPPHIEPGAADALFLQLLKLPGDLLPGQAARFPPPVVDGRVLPRWLAKKLRQRVPGKYRAVIANLRGRAARPSWTQCESDAERRGPDQGL